MLAAAAGKNLSRAFPRTQPQEFHLRSRAASAKKSNGHTRFPYIPRFSNSPHVHPFDAIRNIQFSLSEKVSGVFFFTARIIICGSRAHRL
jgi:hypothetical protein